MNCSCDYEGEPPEFSNTRTVLARKQHICCECGETIEPGEQYECVSGLWEDDFCVFRTCGGCVAIRDYYCSCYAYGRLREALWECLGFDYVTSESQCWECSATIPGATDTCPECGWVEPGSEEERTLPPCPNLEF